MLHPWSRIHNTGERLRKIIVRPIRAVSRLTGAFREDWRPRQCKPRLSRGCATPRRNTGVFQEYRFYRKNPDLVLVDTEVIAQAPPRLLVAGMGDALATWFEARTCVAGHVKNMRGGGSTNSAAALAELCYRTLLEDGAAALRAVETKVVTPALERLVEANTLLSGLGFESSGLAAAHAVHNGLTAAPGTHHYLHGERVAFGLLVQLVLEGSSRTTVEQVLGFSTEVGLPITLAEIGLSNLPQDTLAQIAARAVAPGETVHNEPFEVTPDMVADAILADDALGRAWYRPRATRGGTDAGLL